MTLLTAQKDGRYITELRIDGGPNVAYRTIEADTDEGWAYLMDVDEDGKILIPYGRYNARRVYGKITYVDTREGGQ